MSDTRGASHPLDRHDQSWWIGRHWMLSIYGNGFPKVYPASLRVDSRTFGGMVAESYWMVTWCCPKSTFVCETPGSACSAFSTCFAQFSQVMPWTGNRCWIITLFSFVHEANGRSSRGLVILPQFFRFGPSQCYQWRKFGDGHPKEPLRVFR